MLCSSSEDSASSWPTARRFGSLQKIQGSDATSSRKFGGCHGKRFHNFVIRRSATVNPYHYHHHHEAFHLHRLPPLDACILGSDDSGCQWWESYCQLSSDYSIFSTTYCLLFVWWCVCHPNIIILHLLLVFFHLNRPSSGVSGKLR
jgi:hypothetical protein